MSGLDPWHFLFGEQDPGNELVVRRHKYSWRHDQPG